MNKEDDNQEPKEVPTENPKQWIKIGTKVKFGSKKEYKGEIVGVYIRHNKNYLFTIEYWDGPLLKTQDLYDRNFEPYEDESTEDNKTRKIGFTCT